MRAVRSREQGAPAGEVGHEEADLGRLGGLDHEAGLAAHPGTEEGPLLAGAGDGGERELDLAAACYQGKRVDFATASSLRGAINVTAPEPVTLRMR